MAQNNNPMVVVYTLFASAALFAVLAVLAWLGVIDFGMDAGQLALLFGVFVLGDVAFGIFFLLRVARR